MVDQLGFRLQREERDLDAWSQWFGLSLVVTGVVLTFGAAEFIGDAFRMRPPHLALLQADGWAIQALFAAAFAHFLVSDDKVERFILIGIGVMFILGRQMSLTPEFPSFRSFAAYAFGLASVTAHFYAFSIKKRVFADVIQLVAPTWMVILATSTVESFLNGPGAASDRIFDYNIFEFEDSLGIRIESAVTLAIAAVPGAFALLKFVYATTPIAVAAHYAFSYRDGPRFPIFFVVSGAIGAALYMLLPAIGPSVSMSGYYDSLSAATPISSGDLGWVHPRNCMPSLHAAWAYFILGNLNFRARALRWCFGLYAVLTLVATMTPGLGDHWFIDLVVALPFALAVEAICDLMSWNNERRQLWIIGCGAAIVAIWFFMLRSPLLVSNVGWMNWLMIVLTILISLLFLTPRRASAARADRGIAT